MISSELFEILSICKGGGYRYCRTSPPHPRANSAGLYPLHRVLVENRIGRLLAPDETVHHLDGDKSNDSEENLAVITRADHSRIHALARAPALLQFECPNCGKEFHLKPHVVRLRQRRSKRLLLFCSRTCYHLDRKKDPG